MSTLVSEGSPTSAIGVGCLKMFENLTNKLEKIFSKLKSAPSLTEEQVDSGLKEIRLALLEADVALPVVKNFITNIKPKAIGQEIIRSTSPGQMIVKIVYEELVSILGSKNEELNLAMKKDKKSDDNKSKTKSDDLGSGKIYIELITSF